MHSNDDRDAFWSRNGTVKYFEFLRLEDTQATFLIEGRERTFSTRSSREMDLFVAELGPRVYMDITLVHPGFWAPFLVNWVANNFGNQKELWLMYAEPYGYFEDPNPTELNHFNLSEKFQGIRPVPGFVKLDQVDESSVCLIPLLGFEGNRFSHVLESVQPPKDNVVPIVGLPGYRLDFPFVTYAANRFSLLETGAWRRIRFATANCPYSALACLADIARHYPNAYIKLAPIGTRPHTLAAFVFAIARRDVTEIVYDHPIPSQKRIGPYRLFQYDFRRLLEVANA
jgi:hypothetical protein